MENLISGPVPLQVPRHGRAAPRRHSGLRYNCRTMFQIYLLGGGIICIVAAIAALVRGRIRLEPDHEPFTRTNKPHVYWLIVVGLFVVGMALILVMLIPAVRG